MCLLAEGGHTHHLRCSRRSRFLLWNGHAVRQEYSDECMATAIGFDDAIYKGHQWSVVAYNFSVRQGEGLGIFARRRQFSVDAVMQARNLLMPFLWKAAALEGSGGDIPAAGFQGKLHETGFHPDVRSLHPGEGITAEFGIETIIKSFSLIEELLIRQKRCFWP